MNGSRGVRLSIKRSNEQAKYWQLNSNRRFEKILSKEIKPYNSLLQRYNKYICDFYPSVLLRSEIKTYVTYLPKDKQNIFYQYYGEGLRIKHTNDIYNENKRLAREALGDLVLNYIDPFVLYAYNCHKNNNNVDIEQYTKENLELEKEQSIYTQTRNINMFDAIEIRTYIESHSEYPFNLNENQIRMIYPLIIFMQHNDINNINIYETNAYKNHPKELIDTLISIINRAVEELITTSVTQTQSVMKFERLNIN